MSIYAVLNESEPVFFSSNKGWKDVSDWADSLDEKEYSEVVHLSEHGYTEKIEDLASQLQAAITAKPPDATVAATLAELAELVAGESGVLLINDGTGVEQALEAANA